MAHINLMNLYQDKFQTIHDFRDKYMAMRRICNQIVLRFARCTNFAKAILKKNGNNDP